MNSEMTPVEQEMKCRVENDSMLDKILQLSNNTDTNGMVVK